MPSPITTHVLDTALGRPAQSVSVLLEISDGEQWRTLGSGLTNADGRVVNLLPDTHVLASGVYRLTFGVGEYFAGLGVEQYFYPRVPIIFELKQPETHYHVPLLLNPFGYSTYRGS